jgi:trans-aconitate methyltransferase
VTNPPSTPTDPDGEPAEIDTTVPHPARIYDYLLGGTDHFPVDAGAAEHVTSNLPRGSDSARRIVRANRQFLARVVRYLAGEAGVRQFLDLGTGIPSVDNVHGVAQRTAPESRIVYVDYDPIVLAHAHILLDSAPEGAAAYIEGDVRDPAPILQQAADTLDFDQPIGLVIIGVLHFLSDEEDPYGIVNRFLDALAPGSYLAVSHLADDIQAEEMAEMARRYTQNVPEPMILRSRTDVARFFDGLELVEPGIVSIDRWGQPAAADTPDSSAAPASTTDATADDSVIPVHGAVGRKP